MISTRHTDARHRSRDVGVYVRIGRFCRQPRPPHHQPLLRKPNHKKPPTTLVNKYTAGVPHHLTEYTIRIPTQCLPSHSIFNNLPSKSTICLNHRPQLPPTPSPRPIVHGACHQSSPATYSATSHAPQTTQSVLVHGISLFVPAVC